MQLICYAFLNAFSLKKHAIKVVIIMTLVFFVPSSGWTIESSINAADISTQVDSIAQHLTHKRMSLKELNKWSGILSNLNISATACIDSNEKLKQNDQAQLDSLGKPVKGESFDIQRKREQVQYDIARADDRIATCKLLSLRIKDLTRKANELRPSLFEQSLLSREPDAMTLVVENLDHPDIWKSAINSFVKLKNDWNPLDITKWIFLLIIALASVATGIWTKRRLIKWVGDKKWRNDSASLFLKALIQTVALYAPPLLCGLNGAVYLFIVTDSTTPTPLITLFAYSFCIFLLGIATIQLFFNPPSRIRPQMGLREDLSRKLARSLNMLATLALVGTLLDLLFRTANLSDVAFMLSRRIFALFWVISLTWAAILLLREPRLKNYRWALILATLFLPSSLIAEWLGYHNLFMVIWRIPIGSMLSIGLALLLTHIITDFFDAIDSDRYRWSKNVKKRLGLARDSNIPGMTWLRVSSVILIWVGFFLSILWIWGASTTIFEDIRASLIHGFAIGSLHITPMHIVMAIVAVVFLIKSGKWLLKKADEQWLKRTHIERGAREALVTVIEYSITIIAILVGLGIAGLDLRRLTIVVGALSVGVGFGLQNIVNNFVSGLILLFERPIKTGDWIVVGNTEGYVRRIRIRSTQIQTFDRADVIVPNSELIASQVVNKMLYDQYGRISIPIGVAYGSDTDKVSDILVRLANEHPKAITNGRVEMPYVLFRGFGDSSLNFELRLYIYNIDDSWHVISDINFAIDKAFREANIDIPFPQRDLHIRNWSNQPLKTTES